MPFHMLTTFYSLLSLYVEADRQLNPFCCPLKSFIFLIIGWADSFYQVNKKAFGKFRVFQKLLFYLFLFTHARYRYYILQLYGQMRNILPLRYLQSSSLPMFFYLHKLLRLLLSFWYKP